MKKSKTFECVLLAFFLAASLLVAKPKNKAKTNSQMQAKDEQLFAAEPKQYPFTLIAYGDLRTTDPRNHSATVSAAASARIRPAPRSQIKRARPRPNAVKTARPAGSAITAIGSNQPNVLASTRNA